MKNPNSSPFLQSVIEAIRIRHYSLRTEQAYVYWVRRFIIFHGKRHPRDMGTMEVNAKPGAQCAYIPLCTRCWQAAWRNW